MSEPGSATVQEFWEWFQSNADLIAADAEEHTRLGELDRRVLRLSSELSWEIGPGTQRPWQFVISPNLNRTLRKLARAIVAKAPVLDDWEFHSARLKKDWDYSIEIANDRPGECMNVDAKNWQFVLLRYPDGHREILIEAAGIQDASDDQRNLIGEIVLESLLGEEVFLDSVDGFELMDKFDPKFLVKARPLHDLYFAVTGKAE